MEFTLNAQPGDGVSCVKFSKSPSSSNEFLVSSWDSTTRLYDVMTNTPRATFNFKAACLTCCFDSSAEGSRGFAGGLDKTVRLLDFTRGTDITIGSHENPVSCMQYSSTLNALVTGGWDATLNCWDSRATVSKVASIPTSSKVFSLCHSEEKLVIATGNGQILVYDIRDLSKEIKSTKQKHQIRKVVCLPDGKGYALASVEGRVAVEYFADEESNKSFAFKCHRKGFGQ